MRGNITVKSELNRGTVFILEIPVNAEYTDNEERELFIS